MPGADAAPIPASAEPAISAEPAEAPEPAQAVEPAEATTEVTTGSNLRGRAQGDAPASVQVVGQQSANAGARGVRDALAQLASNNAAESDTESGGSEVNLRGLGAGTTLVLLNGRRILGTGLTNEGQPYYSLGAIPSALIERVEVLKGGASGVYGSDAIAGVVNYITRKGFDGLSLQASGNLATQGGGLRDGEVSAVWSNTSDHGSIAIAVSYWERSQLMAGDRAYGQGDPRKPRFPFKSMVVPATGIPAAYSHPLTLSSSGNPSTTRRMIRAVACCLPAWRRTSEAPRRTISLRGWTCLDAPIE